MTEHKSRKSLVRQRMARTGESYTTANRHITANRRTADVPGMVAGYPRFGSDEHRMSGLCRNLLAQAGLPLSEPMVCGLGGGIGFLYAIFEYRTEPIPLLTIVAQHHPEPWLDAVARHLAITTTRVTSSTAAAALGKLDRALDADRPALLAVGRGMLPWHPGVDPIENADAFPIVVAGRHDGEYLVDDRDAQPHRIDRDTLAAAWAAHRKGRFALTTVDPLPGGIDLVSAVSAAITTTVDHLTGPVLNNYFDANLGLSGMTRLADDLADGTTRRSWRRRFPTDDALATAMHRFVDCLSWQHTAPGGTRPIYARFLAEASVATGLDLSAAVGTTERSARTWLQVVDVARAAQATDPPESATTLRELADLVAAALAAETTMVQQLRAQIGAGSNAIASDSESSS